jgi:beta-phosphoglucomutase-like phosphatase (HAD superfamily)
MSHEQEQPAFVVDWDGEETEAEREHYRALYRDLAEKGLPFVPSWPCHQCGKKDWQEWRLILGHTADGKRIADGEIEETERKGRLFHCSPACWDTMRYESVEMDREEVQELLQEWQEEHNH